MLLLVLCCSCITIMAQQNIPGDDPLLNVPSPAQVRKITIEPGGINAYTPQTLLKILPHLVATDGLYQARKFPQKGTIALQNGTVLPWIAIDKFSLELQGRKRVRLFIVPAECSLTGPRDGPLHPPDGPLFNHSGQIDIIYRNQQPSVILGYMALEAKRGLENVQGFSAEFKCVNGRSVNAFSFRFWATRRLSAEPLALIADGRVLREAILRTPVDESMRVFGWTIYAVDLPRRLFEEMIEAKRVQLRVAEKSFTLSAEQLEALRDLASRMDG